jgi:chromosome segregation protein
VFLRSLSLRGFKSFADTTVLDVEPGITVIVGPNGSGKSNVVDALAWVLGTHSAKKVRGAAMSDVIFAGSPTRARAHRARVEIVVDNADGRLTGAGPGTPASAAAFSEVRVARTIHRDGETGYEINGEPVRALDVQELLSDAGLGRELHTVVGQGQLDEILNAKPEERRRYIEEAAGILKHRRRRERALRKLEQVDGHIDKLRTVLRELRRQLRPLERQAEAADRYQALQAELRAVRVRLAAHDLAVLTRHAADEGRDQQRASAAEREVTQRLTSARERDATLDTELAELAGTLERAQRVSFRLVSLAERLKGTSDLIDAKRRHLVEYVDEPLAGRPPAELRAQADRLEQDRADRELERHRLQAALDAAADLRRGAEQRRRAHEGERQAARRRRSEQRERFLRWEGEVSALRGSLAAAEADVGRVGAALDALDARRAVIEQDVSAVQREIQTLDRNEVELTTALESAEAQVGRCRQRLDELVQRVQHLDARRASSVARAEALRGALADTAAGAGVLLEAGLDGVLGSMAEHVRTDGGSDLAVAAGLGQLGNAVVAATRARAAAAVAWVRDAGAGTIALVPLCPAPSAPPVVASSVARARAAGAVPLGELLSPAEGSPHGEALVGLLRTVLATTFVVADWRTATRLHHDEPTLTFVTRDGDVAGPLVYQTGGAPERSAVAIATAADEAEAAAANLSVTLARLARERDTATAALTAAERSLGDATDRINASDARITGAAERLARLHQERHALTQQRDLVAAQRRELDEVLARDRRALAALHGRGPEPPHDDPDEGPDTQADELDAQVEVARDQELQARVALERLGEGLRHLELQAAALRAEADEVERALAEAARRRRLRREGIVRCGELAGVARSARVALDQAIAAAESEHERVRTRLAHGRERRRATREEVDRITAELDAVRELRHVGAMRRADVERRLEALLERARTELSLTADELRDEHPEATAYDRDALERREDELVRTIGLLGRVNPLALEEFKALEERHAFLSDQLDDLRRSKRDLAEVVVAVDERIREVFREAYEDVAREFEVTFATVFPGGHGRLVLTDAEDLLTAGIEVEARPPGKRVTRLSLLSGGERSLTVLAFVFAIFRARPSPFYVLDEVDAALDDVNLQRLLRLVRSFRGHAQIILVTHQKRSMEIADVLYGVTMGSDAVTKVVAERLRERAGRHDALEARASDVPTEAAEGPDAGRADVTLAVGAVPG